MTGSQKYWILYVYMDHEGPFDTRIFLRRADAVVYAWAHTPSRDCYWEIISVSEGEEIDFANGEYVEPNPATGK